MDNSLVKFENETLSIEENTYKEYLELVAKAKPINDRIKEIESQLKSELKELVSETTTVNDLTFVVGGGFYTFDFDLERFKKEHFDLFMEYLKPYYSPEKYSLKKGAK